ncbi:hypothetical protein [Candidatus Protochlamydia phocaeensis]|uniref:hypothetical protein n=1 Tax=Candidatus Protochlamydia phocaeensis TaxID=1414722 RepID=UPI00083866FB|nr:hypothetical protein [Candidatus Protochlamydia phocaeensis]
MNTAVGFSLTNVVGSFNRSIQERTAEVKSWVQSKSYSYLNGQAKIDGTIFAKIDEKVKNLLLQPGTDIQEGSAAYAHRFKGLQKRAYKLVERNLKVAAQRDAYVDPFKGIDNSLLSRTINKKIAAYQAEQNAFDCLTLHSKDIENLDATVKQRSENIESLIGVLEGFSNPALEELLESSVFDLRESLAQLEALQQKLQMGKKEKAPLLKAYAADVRKQASEALEQAQKTIENLQEKLKKESLDTFSSTVRKAHEIYVTAMQRIEVSKTLQDEMTNIFNPNYAVPGDEEFNEKRAAFEKNKEALKKDLACLEQSQKTVEAAFKKYDALLPKEVDHSRKEAIDEINNFITKIPSTKVEWAAKAIKAVVVYHQFGRAYEEIIESEQAFRDSIEQNNPDLVMLKELQGKVDLYLKYIDNPQSNEKVEMQYINKHQKEINYVRELGKFLKEFAKTNPTSQAEKAKEENKGHARVSSDVIKQALSASVSPRFHRTAASIDGMAVSVKKEKNHRRVQTIGEEAKVELALYADRIEVV